MNTPFKIAAVTLLIVAYLSVSCVVSLLPVTVRLRRAMRIRTVSFFSKRILALLGIRVHVFDPERLRGNNGGRLAVSNHVSYVDVLVISSLLPAVFITSVELKRTLVLGTLARLGGSIFVERRNPSGLKREIRDIARALDQGFPVVLFPEGTTSNGDCVEQFKNSLFNAAVSAGSDILPFCLRYTKINGQPVTPGNRDAVFYYGGMTFFRHLPGLLSRKSVDVDVIPLGTITANADVSRKQLASLAHNAICAAYQAPRAPE
jgi:1-acyl-sn-glycerol-3-phosphate acyltransferase